MRILDKINKALIAGTKGMRRWFNYRKLRSQVRKELYRLEREMQYYPDCEVAFDIVKRQARRASSKIEFAPKSGEFYITNSNDQFIILTASQARIINGIYHYDVHMSGESTQYLDKYLKRIVERRRSLSKKVIEAKIENSLHDILNRIKPLT